MTTLSRRSLLAALTAISSAIPLASLADAATVADDPVTAGLDIAGVKAIAASYADVAGGQANAPVRWISGGKIDLAGLRRAVAQDYASGRMFEHAGWRLSHNEGRLFSLLAQGV